MPPDQVQNQALDPSLVNLAKAIRQVESGGNFAAQGKSGEHGAYQFTSGTWDSASRKYLGQPVPLEQATPEQQNEVVYKRIKDWKDRGYNVGQIASMWNAGEGEPDAYKGTFTSSTATHRVGQPSVGVNSFGAHYNVPAYAKSVATAYQKIKGGGQVGPDPQNPSSINSVENKDIVPTPALPQYSPAHGEGSVSNDGKFTFTNGQWQSVKAEPSTLDKVSKHFSDSISGKEDPFIGGASAAWDIAKGIGNFAFPIVGDLIKDAQGKSDKTALQQLGDAGMSALWFLPFGEIAEGAGLGLKALGVGADLAKAGGAIGTGLATGYAGDVASNLAQGKTGGAAVKPGLGTVIGGGLGTAGSIVDKFTSQQRAIDKIAGAYEDAAGATKTGVIGMSKTAAKGLQPQAEFLSYAGIPPETQEINGRRVFTTGADSSSQQTIQDRLSNLTNLRDKAIETTQATGNLENLRQEMLGQADKEFFGTARQSVKNHVNQEFDAYKGQYGQGSDEIPLADVNKIKIDLQGKTRYDATRPTILTQANKMMSNVVKTQVEDIAGKNGSPAIQELNKIIQQHIDALGFLNKINGQTIKGGRVGTYIKEGIGGSIGLSMNHALGGGLIGEIIGGAGGAYGGNLVSRWLQKLSVGGPMTAATLGRMASEEPQIVQKFLEYLGETNGQRIAPTLLPKAGGLVGKLLRSTPAFNLNRAAKKQ